VDASWEKVRRTRPSHNINKINILYKLQKLKSRQKNILEGHMKLQANSRPRDSIMISIWLTKNRVNQEHTCALSQQWPFKRHFLLVHVAALISLSTKQVEGT